MRWAFKVGEFSGIGVYVHITFLLLLAFIGFSAQGDMQAGIQRIAFLITVFTCVVLHEFGHALAARRYGIPTKDITLYPIGGVARLQRMPEDPKQEIAVSIAGPSVNLLIAAILSVVVFATHSGPEPTTGIFTRGSMLAQLRDINLFLALFNLIPAFPMDGGRILRAILSRKGDHVAATQTAANVGQSIAVLFGLIGLFFNPILLFIALFVWMGAAQEAASVQTRSLFRDVTVRQAMITRFDAVHDTDPLTRAADLVIAGLQTDFPVLDEQENLVGVLTRQKLLMALAQNGQHGRVADAMQREFVTAQAGDPLESALQRLQECSCTTIPVLDGATLAGLLTAENVGEFVMIQSALRTPPRD